MKETIGVFAHVDAGKTTLSEMLMYKSGAIRNPGRVDNGDTLMDYTSTEKNRGITIYSAVAAMKWKDRDFYLVDTPGHRDFADEVECTLNILDKAVLVVSAVEGVQSYTEEIWKYLSKFHIPVVIFINKTDRAGADIQRVTDQLRALSKDCVFMNEESVAERDDMFLEKYLMGDHTKDEYVAAAKRVVAERKLFPVLSGSALKDEGIVELLDLLSTLAVNHYDAEGPFGGIVWKIKYDRKGVKWALIKVTDGKLLPKEKITMPDGSIYKAGEIRTQQGEKLINIKEVYAGDICAVSGIPELKQGDILGICEKRIRLKTEPVLISRVVTEDDVNSEELFKILEMLGEETPTLKAMHQDKQIMVRVHGILQLEVLPEIIRDRYGITVNFERPQVVYKETIAEPVMGYGHYEPLRHYSEVHLMLEPRPRGSGITFESRCSTDEFGKSWQNLVKTHVFERKHRGVLTGAELVDVNIVLMAGKEHYLHTSGGDFREATYRAIRQGLMKSNSILLEPVYTIEFRMDNIYSGNVINRILKMGGSLKDQYTDDTSTCITAVVPVVEMINYIAEFESLTHGKGLTTILETNWMECHNASQVIEEKGYSAENDLQQPADSVFCKKGVARLIKYDQVEKELYMTPQNINDKMDNNLMGC